MMKKFFYILILASFFSAGCASAPYIRSDVFIEREGVKSIYVMPIVSEITIDSDAAISKEDLQRGVRDAVEHSKKVLLDEFTKRGYSVEGYSKNFYELDQNNKQDSLVREAVFEFLKPAAASQNYEGQIVAEVLSQLITTAKITVSDDQGNKKTIDQGEKQAVNETKKEEEIDHLVKKVLAMNSVIPEGVDTVLFVKVESFIAPRGWFNQLSEKSNINFELKMVSLPKEKIIFSYKNSQEKSDILDTKSFLGSLKQVLAKIPVKL